MAAVRCSSFVGYRCGKLVLRSCRQFSGQAARRGLARDIRTAGVVVTVASVAGYAAYRAVNGKSLIGHESVKVFAKDAAADENEEEEHVATKDPIQVQREKRFLMFASVEYDGSVYMTPQDFLESILNSSARARTSRRHLRQNEVEAYLRSTPTKKKSSSHFFGDLFDHGLISYTEYLFLLCILTKPTSGFHIAFNMFDVDGDQKVDKKEFLVLQHLMAGSTVRSLSEQEWLDLFQLTDYAEQRERIARKEPANIWKLLKDSMKKVQRRVLDKKAISKTEAISDNNVRSNIRTNIWNLLLLERKDFEKQMNEGLQDTTLTIHFFGQKGNDVLKFEDFQRFMNDLQIEVLQLEFNKYSRGLSTIHEDDFARILLRYTYLTREEHNEYLERLRRRIFDAKGIQFKDFKDFCLFLNDLDDFALALRIYTYADLPISEADFSRAVKACTGQMLNQHLIHVVFQLFDRDGDGKLSQQEFLSVMKDRLHRGAKVVAGGQWEGFKTCVKNEMRAS